jgi:hypothetical protein
MCKVRLGRKPLLTEPYRKNLLILLAEIFRHDTHRALRNYEIRPENNSHFFPAVNIYYKIMKRTHLQVRRFVSRPYFYPQSLRPPLQRRVKDKQARVCPVSTYRCSARVAMISRH